MGSRVSVGIETSDDDVKWDFHWSPVDNETQQYSAGMDTNDIVRIQAMNYLLTCEVQAVSINTTTVVQAKAIRVHLVFIKP